ncbi:MAG: 30S ribosome-binding factor RbfA [bacterium]
MDPYKTSKLNNSILKTLSELLQVAVKDPRVGFVTLSGVELNKDHSVARVFFSVMGDEEERARSFTGLKKARGFLQGRLGSTLRLRATPELRFEYDDSLDRSVILERRLRDLEAQGEFEDEATRSRRRSLSELQPSHDLLQVIDTGRSFWVVPHWNPDPDAMGSALAMSAALRALGKEAVTVAYPDPPLGLTELPGYGDALLSTDCAARFTEESPDTVLLVDCHRTDRCGELQALLDGFPNIWTIDHHLISKRQAPVPGWVEPRACSAATLVYRVIEEMVSDQGSDEKPSLIDPDLATCLYAGLLNDTGGFRFPNTTPLTFELAQLLSARGVDTAAMARQTLHRYRRQGVELLQRVLATFQFAAAGRILSLSADQAMLVETGASMSDTEGFVNLATAVEGVAYVLFLKELAPEVWRVSLRAPGGGDVQQVAALYGGGGHRQAAGCTIEGSAAEIVERLVADLTETF